MCWLQSSFVNNTRAMRVVVGGGGGRGLGGWGGVGQRLVDHALSEHAQFDFRYCNRTRSTADHL